MPTEATRAEDAQKVHDAYARLCNRAQALQRAADQAKAQAQAALAEWHRLRQSPWEEALAGLAPVS